MLRLLVSRSAPLGASVKGFAQVRSASRFAQLCDEARKNIKEITPEDALALKDKTIFVDVREKDEWIAKGVADVPNLLTIERGVLERVLEQKVPDLDQSLVLYCAGAMRSVLAAESIQKMGYTNATSMIGGFGLWEQKEKPIRQFEADKQN